jgi:type VI secretion system protein ImpE
MLKGFPGETLDEVLAMVESRARKEPAEAKHRIVLFDLLSVMGQWDRALTQLDVAGELSPGALGTVQVYRQALRSEALRSEVFAGKRSPVVLGEPEEWLALLIEALRVCADGRHGEAHELRSTALEKAASTSGRLRAGEADAAPVAFEWIADADPRLGPVLEAVVNGRYMWIPFARIQSIHIEPPADLRDIVWKPAEIRLVNAGEAMGLIPVRYPGSESSRDDAVRLARRTEWLEQGPSFEGLGQKMLATDAGEYALLDLRQIELEAAVVTSSVSPAGPGTAHG